MNIYNYFEQLAKENMITQSFLIGNVSYENIKNELKKIVENIILKKEVNFEENADIIILKSTEKNISRDEIKRVIDEAYKTSQFNNSKIYIIENVEKLTSNSCNALLKTLEEPAENVYAFLLTSNIDSVLPTISSRCQKIFVSSGDNINNFDDGIKEKSEQLINMIETKGVNSIAINHKIYSIIEDKETLKKMLECSLNIYYVELNKLINKEKSNSIIREKNDVVSISKKILLLNDCLNKIEYNLNKDLLIDRILIETWRVNNENS